MSSAGPGSVLVFLTFVVASALLVSIYAVTYFGLSSAAGGAVQQAEAAAEQAVIYLFGSPKNVTGGRIYNETRIVVHNTGRGEIRFERVLAIGRDGGIVAEAVQPWERGLGSAQWLLYRPSELGLPERLDNFTVFRAEVERLVLLSARGRSHGSLWGVPTFLESLYGQTITRTMTETYTYSYVTPTTMTTTVTLTVPLQPQRWSVMGELWVSDDGRRYGRVGRGSDLYSGPYSCRAAPGGRCDTTGWDANCRDSYYSARWLHSSCQAAPGEEASCLPRPRINNTGIILLEKLDRVDYRIFYAGHGANLTALGSRSFWQYGKSKTCAYDSATGQWVWRITEWGKRFDFQAIELVDWDTGEVFASTNSSSLTFQVGRNTIVRFKYVKTESWSRTWIIVPPPPAPPSPERCAEIISREPQGSRLWCECAKILNLPEYEDSCRRREYCLTASVRPCCVGAPNYNGCLSGWSAGIDRPGCVELDEGRTASATVRWWAQWSLKPGWRYKNWGQMQERAYASCSGGQTPSGGLEGTCTATLPPSKNVDIVVVFEQS